MQNDTVNALKQTLLDEKLRLEALLGRTSKHLYRREEPYDADFEEQAVETQNNEVVEHIDREAQIELTQINKALVRIAEGTYGECTGCGAEIGEQRLQALPHTEFCIRCADAK